MKLNRSYQLYGIDDDSCSGVLRRIRQLMELSSVSLEHFQFLNAQTALTRAIEIAGYLQTDIEEQERP